MSTLYGSARDVDVTVVTQRSDKRRGALDRPAPGAAMALLRHSVYYGMRRETTEHTGGRRTVGHGI